MVERKSKPRESKKCDVCGKPAERSVARSKAAKVPELGIEDGPGKVHLCKEHYKIFKKATKKERKLDSLSWH